MLDAFFDYTTAMLFHYRLAGVLVIAFGIFETQRRIRFLLRAQRATGYGVDYGKVEERIKASKSARFKRSRPTFEYTDDDSLVHLAQATMWTGGVDYGEGTEHPIWVDPANPERVQIRSFALPLVGPFCIAAGVGLIYLTSLF